MPPLRGAGMRSPFNIARSLRLGGARERKEPVMKRAKIRAALTTAALLAALAGATSLAGQTAFPDTQGHHLEGDVSYAVERGWFKGYPNGTFKPDHAVSQRQIATVVERAFPSGSSRAEMASFMRGGQERIDAPVSPVRTATIPDRIDGYVFGHEFILAEIWVSDEYSDNTSIVIRVRDGDNRVMFSIDDGGGYWTVPEERDNRKIWEVNPHAEYVITIDGMGPGDEVRYRFTPLLPVRRVDVEPAAKRSGERS